MRSCAEIEIAFTGMLKASSVKSPASASRPLNILLRKLPGKVLEKFQIFSDTTADHAVFDSGERRLPARSRLISNSLHITGYAKVLSASGRGKWRRGELNPCPRRYPREHLHVYPVTSFKEPNVAPTHCRLPSIREFRFTNRRGRSTDLPACCPRFRR
jgi:hypothetical protein